MSSRVHTPGMSRVMESEEPKDPFLVHGDVQV